VSKPPALDNPGPSGLGEPYEGLLDPFNTPPKAFCIRGLALGDPFGVPKPGLPLPDKGEVEYTVFLLIGEPLCGAGDRGYRGGVIY